MRFLKSPVPTCFSQRSNSPARSATKTTNVPSGEISAAPSVPSQSVKRENCALASGSSSSVIGRRASHTPTAPASVASAIHGSHFARPFTEAAADPTSAVPGSTSSIALSSILTSPISLRRCFGSLARHRSNSRRMDGGVAAGSADQSGSRSRIFAIVSEAVSPGNVRRPVSIS